MQGVPRSGLCGGAEVTAAPDDHIEPLDRTEENDADREREALEAIRYAEAWEAESDA